MLQIDTSDYVDFLLREIEKWRSVASGLATTLSDLASADEGQDAVFDDGEDDGEDAGEDEEVFESEDDKDYAEVVEYSFDDTERALTLPRGRRLSPPSTTSRRCRTQSPRRPMTSSPC